MQDTKLLAEVKATKERVIAISLHNPDKSGFKGTITDFDDVYVDFNPDKGKRELLPIASYRFKRLGSANREAAHE